MVFHPFLGFFWLAGLVIVIAIPLLLIWATTGRRPLYTPPPAPAPSETPLDILARRFASGEITAEEYQKARDLLKEKKP